MAEEQTSRQYLRAALEAGERNLQGLRLGGVDGLDLDLSDCNLEGSCFKEARFGHARLRGRRCNAAAFSRRCCGERISPPCKPRDPFGTKPTFWLPPPGIEL